ncbi:pyridoxal phosphate-dependent aminotransferase [Adlercreutzia sp. ZJ138]|uniref:pyridoxal phosphate-dependent aminotransferase n=1 Tax=Adlercreutzia sp. ZJ138 TaxID=2709405 RepID=UPI0013EC8BD7|nr:pyridoxal phosphate-dependent aminotransferase [Adlercreutzia sp. ZJ138]
MYYNRDQQPILPTVAASVSVRIQFCKHLLNGPTIGRGKVHFKSRILLLFALTGNGGEEHSGFARFCTNDILHSGMQQHVATLQEEATVVSERMRVRLSRRSAIREAFERAGVLARTHGADNVFDLSIGNPTAPCPAGVAAALKETAALPDEPNMHGYMDSAGYSDVRDAMAASLKARFGIDYTTEDIVMTTGAACALNIVMQTLLDPGDEIIVFRPYYPAYEAFALNWDARVVKVPYCRETMLPDVSRLDEAFSPRTKIVLVNTPNNPSGLVYPHAVAEAIAHAAERAQQAFSHDIYVVSDEPYRELLFDSAQNPQWPLLYNNTFTVYSFSKSASISGERIGYVAMAPGLNDKQIIRQGLCRSLGDLGFVNAPATAQRMAKHCVDSFADLAQYDRNRIALYEALCSVGFSPVKPNGAFYMLLPAPDGNEQAFVDRLLAENIVVVGGGEFGCPGYVRLSFCVSAKTIDAAIPHFACVAHSYGLNATSESSSALETSSALEASATPSAPEASMPTAPVASAVPVATAAPCICPQKETTHHE